MATAAAGLTMEPGRCDHAGQPLDESLDFPVPAPAEIGPLCSAHSTLRTGNEPPAGVDHLLNAALFAGTGALLVLGVERLIGVHRYPRELVFALASLAGAAYGYHASRFEHTVTYVGRDGIARYRIAGARDRIVDREMFLFRQATRLRRLDGVTFEWVDDAGGVLCRLRDRRAEAGWCNAAERAWDAWRARARALPDGTPAAPDRALIVGGIELVVPYFPRQFLVVMNGRAIAIPRACACCCTGEGLVDWPVTGSSLRQPLRFHVCRRCRRHVRVMVPMMAVLLVWFLVAALARAWVPLALLFPTAWLLKRAVVRPGCPGLDWPVTARGRKDGFVSKDPKLRAALDEHWMAVGDEGVELKLVNAEYVRQFLELNRGDRRDIRRLEGPPCG